jgi:hypothetical protein
MALVDRIISRDVEATAEAIDSLAVVTRTAHNVAERLLTGRRAEEYFLTHSAELIGVEQVEVIDRRQSGCGFDFTVSDQPEMAIEVKGIKAVTGDILFTDREWTEARSRRENYWLVIVGNLDATPSGKVVCDPYCVLPAHCSYQVTVAARWRSWVSVSE